MDCLDRYVYLDTETQSGYEIDPKKKNGVGAYHYMDSPDFRMVLLSYAIGENPVQTLDFSDIPAGHMKEARKRLQEAAPQLYKILYDPGSGRLILAYNAQFDRNVLARALGLVVPVTRWRDPLIWTRALYNLGRKWASLGDAGAALGLPEDQAKLEEGSRLVDKFGKPVAIDPADPDWQTYLLYNSQDVTALREVTRRLYDFRPGYTEWRHWCLSEQINDRGLYVNQDLARQVVTYAGQKQEQNKARFAELVGPSGPASPGSVKLMDWLTERGVEPPKSRKTGKPSLDKTAVAELLNRPHLPSTVREVLQTKQAAGQSSLKKFQKARRLCSDNGRLQGSLTFYGAHTGRWASHGLNAQNMKQMTHDRKELDILRDWMLDGQFSLVDAMLPEPEEEVSELGRTLFEAPKGYTFLDSDFAQIEARVTQYLATLDSGKPVSGNPTLEAFRRGEDIYCMVASQMYHKPVEKHGVNGELRKYGKTATLSCGYGGARTALRVMGLTEQDASDAEANRIVRLWREANPEVTGEWNRLQRDCYATVEDGNPRGRFSMVEVAGSPVLRMALPSGRYLYYWTPEVVETTKHGDWGDYQSRELWVPNTSPLSKKEDSYLWGGKLFENLVQATARDILAVALQRLAKQGIPVVLHIHDEVVCEIPSTAEACEHAMQIVREAMSTPPDWMPGLPLAADAYLTPYFTKD